MYKRQFTGRFIDDFPGTAGLLMSVLGFFILEAILHMKLPDKNVQSLLFSLAGVDSQVLHVLGSCSVKAVQEGEIWRIVAAMFLHGGAMHLILNAVALADLGRICEPMLGTERFLTVYICTGILASLASLGYKHFSGIPMVGMVGASGAIMGMMGLLFGFSLRYRDRELRDQLMHSLVYIAIMSLALRGIIDHAAHIGGFAGGMIFGWFTPRYTSSDVAKRWRIPCWISIAVCAASIGFSVWNQFRVGGFRR